MNLFSATSSFVFSNVFLAIFFFLLSIAVCLIAIWLLVKFINKDKGATYTQYIAFTILGGVLVRIIFAIFIGGYRLDINIINSAINNFINNGFGDYYNSTTIDVYPLSYYVFSLFGGVVRGFGVGADSVYLTFFIKIPLIMSDAIAAFIVYKLGKKYINTQTGIIFSGIISFFPPFIIGSSLWGAQVVLLVPVLLLSIYLLLEKRHALAIILYSLSMLIAKESIYMFAVFAVYYGYLFVRSIICAIKEKAKFTQIIKEERFLPCVIVPIAIFVGALIQYLVSLPLAIKGYGVNPFVNIYKLFIQPLFNGKYFTYNGLSIFSIFGSNADLLGDGFPTEFFAIAFILLSFAVVSVVFFSRKNRAVIPLLGAYIPFIFATYVFEGSIPNLIPVLIVMLLSFIFIKDKRILYVFFALTIAFTFASISVLANANCLNNLSPSNFVNIVYSLTKGGWFVFYIIGCVIAILAHLYLTFVIFDITMSNNRKMLDGDENVGIYSSLSKFIRG